MPSKVELNPHHKVALWFIYGLLQLLIFISFIGTIFKIQYNAQHWINNSSEQRLETAILLALICGSILLWMLSRRYLREHK